jgi:hypothetical protein
VKAWVRRGTARHKRGKYLSAIADFKHALTLDPANPAVQKSLHEAEAKYR